MSLVADVTIERDTLLRGHRCVKGTRLCSYGTLPRPEEHPTDPVVSVRPGAVERLGGGTDPLTGRFAFILSRHRLRLVDPVVSPVDSYLTPIEPDAMATANSLPVGTLIAARGWLSVLERDKACPKVPRALDGRRDGWDSAFVRCPGGWLTPDEVVETDPDDPLRPTVFGIPVQFGALDRYGTRFGTEEPGLATYLLRRVKNPIPGRKPKRGWRIAGRLDALDGILMPAAPEFDEASRPGGLDWQPVIGRQPPADTRRIATTDWSGGLASAHEGTDHVLSTWVSNDGSGWEAAELPPRIRSVAALLALKDGLALIANERVLDRVRAFDVWRSGDGLTWQRAGRQRISSPSRFRQYRRIMTGYWSLGDRIVTIESYSQQPSSGDTVGIAPDDPGPDVTHSWISRDGRRWQRRIATGLGGAQHGIHGRLFAQGEDELVLLQADRSRDIRRTTDGVHWDRIGTYPEEFITNAPSAFTRVEDGFLVAGEPTEDTYGDGNFLTVWRGTGNGDWVRTVNRPGRMPTAIVASGSTVVLTGDEFDFTAVDEEFDPAFVPYVMVSNDGGRTWDESLEWSDEERWCLEGLASLDGTILLQASCPPRDAATTYRVTVPG